MFNANPERDQQNPASDSAEKKSRTIRFALSQETWITLGILVLTLAVFLQVLGFDFVSFDDSIYLTNNPTIQAGLNWKSLRYAFTSGDDGSYLPLIWLSHAACASLFGNWAGGHHLINLLLHATNSVLLFYFLKRLTKVTWPSAAVAFLFALHPLHVESVAWIAERKDVLSTLFWILTSWAYLRYVERPSLRRYAGMALLFTLGLLSKSMLVTLPLTLLLFDAWPLGRIEWTGVSVAVRAKKFGFLIAEKLPLLALSLAAGVATLFSQKSIGAVSTLINFPLHQRLGNALLATTTYLQQMVWPLNLSAFYPFSGSELMTWKVAGASSLLLGITVTCLLNLRRRPYLALGWSWYLITLLPVAGIIQVGGQSHADRYTYVPLIGIFLMLCWLGEELITRWCISRRVILLSAASFLGVLCTLTAAQTTVWQDDRTLFQHALSLDSHNPMAYAHLGDAYAKENRYQEAAMAYLKAFEYWPNDYVMRLGLGDALQKIGHYPEALHCYQSARRLAPDQPVVDHRIGGLLVRLGHYLEAEPFLQRALTAPTTGPKRLDPLDLQVARIGWAIVLRARNRFPEALELLESVVLEAPNVPVARLELSQTLILMGRREEALHQLELARELNPRNPSVLYLRGAVLIELSRFAEARSAFEQLKAVEPQSPLLKRGLLELDQAQTAPPARALTLRIQRLAPSLRPVPSKATPRP